MSTRSYVLVENLSAERIKDLNAGYTVKHRVSASGTGVVREYRGALRENHDVRWETTDAYDSQRAAIADALRYKSALLEQKKSPEQREAEEAQRRERRRLAAVKYLRWDLSRWIRDYGDVLPERRESAQTLLDSLGELEGQ